MTDRREFLQGACLSAALPLATGLPHAARAQAPASLALGRVLVDERHPESRSFGARLAARGATVRTVPQGDVTQLWLSEIGPAWRQGPMAVAGLTRRPVLFCLEQLAWTHGLRVVFHAEHIVDPAGRVQHEILRCAGTGIALSADDLARLGARWPGRMAEALAARGEQSHAEPLALTCSALEPALPQGSGLLTSWIIAAA